MFNSFYNQTPTYNAIFAFTRFADATTDKILKACYEIKRWDVITQIQNDLLEFSANLNYSINNRQFSRAITNTVPLELRQLNEESSNNARQTRTKRYDKIILLTFASESNSFTDIIVQKLRGNHNGKRIGVLVLNEHSARVNQNYDVTIRAFFRQADYVIPILTNDYLNIINSWRPAMNSAENLDNRFVNYIYSLMSAYYLDNGCLNDKIRCIIFDDMASSILSHKAMKSNSILKVWFYFSDIDRLAERILDDNKNF